ncbi:MAG: HEAT repeat domain-containing protein [Clostridiales bacterium]|nr:HEAT repeat domain-containing protein [Clostridiales bacterium]
MAKIDRLTEKIEKLGKKQNLGALLKMIDDPEDEVRVAVAKAMGQISTYESGMQLIPLFRDTSPMVRAAAAESAGLINAKHCEEYLKKLAFADSDPSVRAVAREAYDKMKTRVV